MRLGTYTQFILLMVFLSGSKEEVNYGSSGQEHTTEFTHLEDRNNNLVKESKQERNRDDIINTDDETKTSGTNEFFFIVAIMIAYGPRQGVTYGQRTCTGTLIRHDMVITLAICVLYDHNYDPDPDTISIFERPGEHRLKTVKIIPNGAYYSEDYYISTDHNYALIVVEGSRQTAYFPRLPQTMKSFDDIKHSCILAGYGKNNDKFSTDNFMVYNMSKIQVNTHTGRACSGTDSFCLHFSTIMACEADFGTPLICGKGDKVLYALFTPRPGPHNKCKDFYVSVFLYMYSARDWVTRNMESPFYLELLNNPWFVLLLCCVVFIFMGCIYCVLIEVLQRTFDLSENLETRMSLADGDRNDDEDIWYESQWTTR